MTQHVLIAGGGIGGLACALALVRAGVSVDLLEQAGALGEVGAGLQLGPNAVRVLDEWGLMDELHARAAFPEALVARDAHNGQTLGGLRLGSVIRARYGQPYATIHRADLHGLLLQAVQQHTSVRVHLGARLASFDTTASGVRATCDDASVFQGAALVGADGLWSRVRTQLLGAQPVRVSGHLAYRGMVPAERVPAARHGSGVTVWLGPRLHVVHYPVKRGDWFNVVAVVHGTLGQGHGGPPGGDPQSWTHAARWNDLQRALGPVCTDLRDMLEQVGEWKLWALNDRPPVASAQEHAQGRVALLGDAAHPLRPYLAQGAAMAIEDAWTLGRLVQGQGSSPGGLTADEWPALLARYARTRWPRNARVQERSARNGSIFHATGALRLGRNMAMALLGESLLDNPWLYAGPPEPVDAPLRG